MEQKVVNWELPVRQFSFRPIAGLEFSWVLGGRAEQVLTSLPHPCDKHKKKNVTRMNTRENLTRNCSSDAKD